MSADVTVEPNVHTVEDGFGDLSLMAVFELLLPILALGRLFGKPKVNVKVMGLVLVQGAD